MMGFEVRRGQPFEHAPGLRQKLARQQDHVRVSALRRRAFARHIHGQDRHLVAFEFDVAIELADAHERVPTIDDDHDAVVGVLSELRFGAQHGHRAVRDGVRRAKLNPAQLQDGHVAVKLPAGDDPHFERRAACVHGTRPQLRAHARRKRGGKLIRREMKFWHRPMVSNSGCPVVASGARRLRHMQGRRAGIPQ